MPRLGQDITKTDQPGLLGDSSKDLIPKEFKKDLSAALKAHPFEHGSGLNRWQLTGTYPKQSWEHGLPAAGAHSGGTSDIFLALNCLGAESVFGKEEAKVVGLLVSSFMNFGGYHSFVETFPIAQAVATDSVFEPKVTGKHKKLYQEMFITVESACVGPAVSCVRQYLQAYNSTMARINKGRMALALVASAAPATDVSHGAGDAAASGIVGVAVDAPPSSRVEVTEGEDPLFAVPLPEVNTLALVSVAIHDLSTLVGALGRSGASDEATILLGQGIGVAAAPHEEGTATYRQRMTLGRAAETEGQVAADDAADDIDDTPAVHSK